MLRKFRRRHLALAVICGSFLSVQQSWNNAACAQGQPQPVPTPTGVYNASDFSVGYDLQLLAMQTDLKGIPSEGKNLIVVASVNNVLHFRVFDADRRAIVDLDETSLTTRARQIEYLKKFLQPLWPPHKLSAEEKAPVIAEVLSVVGLARSLVTNSAGYPGGTNNAPAVLPEEKPLPINLATALRLGNAQAWDIAIAGEQIRVANAQLLRANVLWFPSIVSGVDYQHHDGVAQNPDGSLTTGSRSSVELGGAPEMVFALTDAIFSPLAAREVVKSRKADLQTATNDTMYSVARAYFDVQQARGNLAGARDAIQRTRAMLNRIQEGAPDFWPVVEVARARAQLAKFDQVEEDAREQWNVASAELIRIVRLDPRTVVLPIEAPHLQVTLIPPDQPLENLLPVALNARPELASFRALTQAALKRWREEQFRPALPSVYLRGGSNQLPDSMMFGSQSGGPGGTFGAAKGRADYELQVMWELSNLGFGNAAAMRERKADYEVTRMQAYRLQDFVAREVAQAYAQTRSARARVIKAEVELREAEISAFQNYEGLGTVKRLNPGNIIIPVLRPQEAVAAMQALLQAYNDYYGTVADYNRTQFQLYRALGNPAQMLPLLNQPNSADNLTPPAMNAAIGMKDANRSGATAAGANTATPQTGAVQASSAPTRPVPSNATPQTGVIQAASSPSTNRPTPGDNPMPQASPDKALSATMLVRVPANAELYCEGIKLKMTGSERNFTSPPLPPGKTYSYEIRVRWTDADGKPVEESRQVHVQAGEQTTADFLVRNPH